MSLGRYSILVVAIIVSTLGVAWPVVLRRLDASARWAVAFGAAIAVLNATAAHALTRWSVGRSTVAFMGAVLVGMAARMALMLVALLAGVLLLELPRLPFAVSLLGYFILFLALELTIAQRRPGAPAGAAR